MSKDRLPTSVSIDPAFWKKVRMAALERDMNVSEFVEKGMMEYMEKVSISSNPMVQKAMLILNRFHNMELMMKSEGLEIGKTRKGLRNNYISMSQLMSEALTVFERVLNLKRDPSTEHLIIRAADTLVSKFNEGLTTGLIIEGPGLMSKVERLTKENERLLKEIEQLRNSLQNVSAAYEEFSAKNR